MCIVKFVLRCKKNLIDNIKEEKKGEIKLKSSDNRVLKIWIVRENVDVTAV